ncbi:hypothetical protein Z517_09193 [Fonsecaea pedrosoi CBS 271.37]|uniref:Uncharacterized protein n=1 Tax=Fonsecaea pedrosoi CBS 271.37 TaxID=1442368 RepID=A0A0D2GWK7_9EURO|nr:uncharacterized protein Z517_09193 [Fonsecaea pedrosoi CBS 271.37]KIW76749.1 hypothetical protein Z517_09193 [Fonsecaea pedrosoi CBS 271.37]
MSTVEAGPDPHDGFSPAANPNHSSSDVSTTTNILTRLHSSDPQSASTLSLIVEQIERYYRDHSPSLDIWLPYHLSPQGLGVFEELTHENPHWKHLRYDYFPRTSTFVLRMSASLEHEWMEKAFCKLVEDTLAQLCLGDPKKKEFLEETGDEGHTPLKEGEFGTHSPDAQFRHVEAKYPGVILEVAYSQKTKSLSELAHIYITEGTKLVVGLDQDYPRSKKIMLRTWGRRIEPATESAPPRLFIDHHSQEIRSFDGKPVPNAQLRIPILDLAPKVLIPESLHDEFIVISCEELCRSLRRVDHTRLLRDHDALRTDDLPSGLVYVPTPASSASDTLSDDDDHDAVTAHDLV